MMGDFGDAAVRGIERTNKPIQRPLADERQEGIRGQKYPFRRRDKCISQTNQDTKK